MIEVDLMRRSVTADALGRYYTSTQISNALINSMTDVFPNSVLELGSGQGSLASAACQKWKGARYVTVDTDHAAKLTLDGLVSPSSHEHHIHDALDDDLATKIGISLGSFDAALCNPPFVRPRWRTSFGHILEDAGLSGALQSIHDAGADLLFIAQNLRLLKRQGKLGLILPDGLITGEKYRGVRDVLLREHKVDLVVQLPRRVFSKTEAQTYLLVLSKTGGPTQSVSLSLMTNSGELSAPLLVPTELAKLRLDYAFHSHEVKNVSAGSAQKNWEKVGSLVEEVVRGNIISSEIDACPVPVFHLGDFPINARSTLTPKVPSRFIITSRAAELKLPGYKVAHAGDILIARIGRNLYDKVCVLERGSCVISDCVYALRVSPRNRQTLLAYLTSSSGKNALSAASHGVGASYLTRADVLNILVPV